MHLELACLDKAGSSLLRPSDFCVAQRREKAGASLQVQFAQGFTSFTVEEENMILLAANSILGSQQSYEWNVLLETWVDPPTGNVRTILKTYVTENYTSIDQAGRPYPLHSTPWFPDALCASDKDIMT